MDFLRRMYYTERARTIYTLPEPPRFPERLTELCDEWAARRAHVGRFASELVDLETYRMLKHTIVA